MNRQVTSSTAMLPAWTPWMMAVSLLVMLLVGMMVRFSAVAIWDDAWFYTRYGSNLIEQGSYQWNVGERGYGLTAPLYGFLIAGLQFIGLPPSLALWGVSFSAGLILIFMISNWVIRYPDPNGKVRILLVSFATLSIGMNIPTLCSHFGSGMETTVSMAYFMGYLLLFHAFCWQLTPFRTLILGAVGGLAWGIRPELCLLTWGIPIGIALFSRRPAQRKGAAYVVLFTSVLTMFQMYLGLEMFGSVMPLSFWAKTTNPYGPEMAVAFRTVGIKQFVLFLAVNIVPISAIGFAIFKGKRAWWRYLALHERLMVVGLIAFWMYHVLIVLPIMSYSARFFYPFWPGLMWLGIRSLLFLISTQETMLANFSLKKWFMPTLTLFVVLITTIGSIATFRTRHAGSVALMGKFSVEAAYEGVGRQNWPGLDAFSAWPSEFGIASTELGILGMMRLGAPVYDMSGLHDASILHSKFNPEQLLARRKPDLVYMPSPAYQTLLSKFNRNPTFLAFYEVLQPVRSFQPVAIRKDSPRYEEMKTILSEL